MIEMNVDPRVLNMMRETLNYMIEDKFGLIKIEEFKRAIYTAYGKKNTETTDGIYKALAPIVTEKKEEDGEEMVSVPKLALFIDFFNFYPCIVGNIKQKNHSSVPIEEFMGNPKANIKKSP